MSASFIATLRLANFRNYDALALDLTDAPVILVGSNGAGKTNLLEAVSLLAPGQGLRRTPFPDLARMGGPGDWSVAATVETAHGPVSIGTGIQRGAATSAGGRGGRAQTSGRLVRIDGEPASGSGALADYLEMVWLTPSMDGLFTGPAGDRRRFLDRLIICFDPGYRTRANQFERAMRQRNRLLEMDHVAPAMFEGLELQMAEIGIALAATRAETVAQISASINARRKNAPDSPFPWAELHLEGEIEQWLASMPALDAEDAYVRQLAADRPRDRAARRTLTGPHRSDLLVGHGPKEMPARLCSTGEQKALLINLVLAHASLVKFARNGAAPILLLDEIAAHLDVDRRAALFGEILKLGCQAWLTGTDKSAFEALDGKASGFFMQDAEIKAKF
ncbi:MAG: DNA replication/repair protein RecF [Pseudomonadota bacterium]